MGTVPPKEFDRLVFYEQHIAPFTANAVAIGTTVLAVTDLTTKATDARAAWEAKLAAEQASRTATSAWHTAMAPLTLAGSAIIDQIRAKAKIGGDSIYDLAEIPVPATPTPVSTLGEPNGFKATLDQNATLTVTWKCSSPRATGVTYQVYRRNTPTSEFVFLGGTGEKKWEDSTIPAGSSEVAYKIQATRSTAKGPWAVFTVFFGQSSSGEMVASVGAPKLAA